MSIIRKWLKSLSIEIVLIIVIIAILAAIAIPSYQDYQHRKDGAPLTQDGWIVEDSYYEKEVYYGTTRFDKCETTSTATVTCTKDPERLNTGNDGGLDHIVYGNAYVKIPFDKSVGGTDGMSLSGIEHDIGWEIFKSGISSEDILVFVHGYNTSFSNAAIRTAQLAHDTNFIGEAVLFSWPSSQGKRLAHNYRMDKGRANENVELLAEFLLKIAGATDKKIHIVAHSMGGYILTNSLAIISYKLDKNNKLLKLRRGRHNNKIFNQIILAAPDVANNEYELKFTKYNYSDLAERITLYSAVNDNVLKASTLVNIFLEGTGEHRLGTSLQVSGDNFKVINGMDTVDTRQEIAPQFFGHSFYANYRSLVTDIYLILNYSTRPDNRMLQKVIDKNKRELWFIRD